MCQASWAKAYDEDFVSRVHSSLVEGSHATRCRFYHRSFLEACLGSQIHNGSSSDIGLGDSEVLWKSARIEVCLLEEITHSVVCMSAVFAIVARHVMVCDDPVRFSQIGHSITYARNRPADLVAQDSAGSICAVGLFDVSSAYSGCREFDQTSPCRSLGIGTSVISTCPGPLIRQASMNSSYLCRPI